MLPTYFVYDIASYVESKTFNLTNSRCPSNTIFTIFGGQSTTENITPNISGGPVIFYRNIVTR